MFPKFKTANQLERELNAFTTAIQEAAWNSTPVIKIKLRSLNVPKEIRNLIAENRKLRRKWRQSKIHMNCPSVKNLRKYSMTVLPSLSPKSANV
jgi:hypothetical protein